jgi:ACT domain-containing protein
MSKSKAIQLRIDQNKGLIIEKLKNLPIVQIACEKVGVGRATYYRWREDDPNFADNTNQAIQEGRRFINDMAESQLLSAIKDQNMTAIIYWLNHNHPIYATRVEIDAKLKMESEDLTPEQETIVNNALKLAGLLSAPKTIKKRGIK